MDISLIICTRDHCDQLVRCLNSIQGIVFDQPWELIVVDNGSIDETRSVVREFISIIPISTLYIFEQNPGKSNALNTAIKTARGEILAFTDDDCEPASDFLAQIWSAFNDPAVGFIGGRIVERDPADHSIMVGGPTIPRTFPARSFIAAGVVQGGNMAFRQTVLREIGGFDPLFGPGRFLAGEDCDAAGRASAMGWSGEYRPEVLVRHHHGRKASDKPRVRRSYAIGRGAYHMKLLLSGEFACFAQSVYEIPRSRLRCGTFLWEQLGAMKYTYLILARYFQNRSGRSLSREI